VRGAVGVFEQTQVHKRARHVALPADEAGPIAEGLALIDKTMRNNRPGPHQIQAAISTG
jgi:hypothetical protein